LFTLLSLHLIAKHQALSASMSFDHQTFSTALYYLYHFTDNQTDTNTTWFVLGHLLPQLKTYITFRYGYQSLVV